MSGIERAYRNKQSAEIKQDGEGRNGNADEAGRNVLSASGSAPLCIGFSEVNKYAIQVYETHFKGHKNYGDATRIIPEELHDFDFLCGGFPCQAFSIAGKRGGFKDTRGTLFFEIARILSVKRPKLLLLENVKGLLSHDRGRTFGTILSALSELGYICQWQVLNSKDFGVPQNRERVFIVGHLGEGSFRKVFPISQDSSSAKIKIVGTTIGEDCTRHGERDVVFGKDGLMGCLKSTDYKQPPQLLELTDGESQGYRVYDADGIATTQASQAGGVGAKTGLYAIPVLTPDREHKRQNGRRMKEDGDPSFTLTAQDKHGIFNGRRVRRLTPTECERLQGFPDGWTASLSDSQRYKCLGNAVTTNVITAIMQEICQ